MLGTHCRGCSHIFSSVLSPVVGTNLPTAARAGSPIPAALLFPLKLQFLFKHPQSGFFGGLKGGRGCPHKRQIWHKHPTMGLGTNVFCSHCGGWEGCPQPWTLMEQKTLDFNHFQCGCNEDNDPYFKELEFINIWSVLCCQTQLSLLRTVLLFDLTHKLFLSIPQWFGARN